MRNRILRRVQYACFPTQRQRALKKWHRDGGDHRLRFDYDLSPASLVLDVGGYHGQWSSDLFSMYCCRIMVFEPVSEFVTSIERRFRANPNISVHRFGLGKTSRVETISLCADGSSVFRESGKTERIEIVDIAEWLRRNTISRIDLMKVNIEGGEYELLERLIETGMIEGVRNLQVQFHQMSKESVCRMERIQECLKSTHHPTYQYRFVWENWVSNDK